MQIASMIGFQELTLIKRTVHLHTSLLVRYHCGPSFSSLLTCHFQVPLPHDGHTHWGAQQEHVAARVGLGVKLWDRQGDTPHLICLLLFHHFNSMAATANFRIAVSPFHSGHACAGEYGLKGGPVPSPNKLSPCSSTGVRDQLGSGNWKNFECKKNLIDGITSVLRLTEKFSCTWATLQMRLHLPSKDSY